MIKTSVSFNVVISRLVQFSCDHVLFQVPIREKKNTQEIVEHTERWRESKKKKKITSMYKIRRTIYI